MANADQTQHVVITGGGSGIGFATAGLFAQRGARVTILDRDPAAKQAAADIGAGFAALDVTDEVAVEDVAALLEAQSVAPGILVTCAGTLQRTLPPEKLGWSEWDKTISIHLRGTYACCKSFGTRMAARGGGSIVTIGSVAGILSGPLHAYGPAKAGISYLASSLAAEWGPSGVRVNCVAPGFTETPALDKGLSVGALDSGPLAESAALGRLISSEEIAQVILFLSSGAASAVTGVTIPVDAGFLAASGWAAYGGLRRP